MTTEFGRALPNSIWSNFNRVSTLIQLGNYLILVGLFPKLLQLFVIPYFDKCRFFIFLTIGQVENLEPIVSSIQE
jgi:hypothetical protein